MIYLTSDTHCPYDMAKLNSRRFPLARDDSIIICGDFGCVWYGNNEDRYWLDLLESKCFHHAVSRQQP